MAQLPLQGGVHLLIVVMIPQVDESEKMGARRAHSKALRNQVASIKMSIPIRYRFQRRSSRPSGFILPEDTLEKSSGR